MDDESRVHRGAEIALRFFDEVSMSVPSDASFFFEQINLVAAAQEVRGCHTGDPRADHGDTASALHHDRFCNHGRISSGEFSWGMILASYASRKLRSSRVKPIQLMIF